MPTGFHAHAHLFSLGREVAIKLFRFLGVFQALLSAISRFGIDKRNLFESPGGNRILIMIIVRLLSTRAFRLVSATKFTRVCWEPALLWNQ